MIWNYVISGICLAGAAVFSAVMDVAQFHPERLPKWWRHDWKRKYINNNPDNGRKKIGRTRINYPVQFLEGWHFSKMCLVILVVSAILTAFNPVWWGYLIGYGAGYLLWNVPFNLFYNYWL